MSELKPTDKGYIEALAKRYDNFVSGITQDEIRTAKFDFTQGYKSALEHNNVPELIEAAKAMYKELYDLREHCIDRGYIDFNDNDIDGVVSCNEAIDKGVMALTKAEQNKLNK